MSVLPIQRMPGMGWDRVLLSKWLRLSDPSRILLNGYSDIASVIDASIKGKFIGFID